MPPTDRIVGFAPVADPTARILILGSMPGDASLAAGEYYAHPRNGFWRIMTALLGLPAAASYGERTRALLGARIALWDVVQSCRRAGSLDTAIERTSIRVNDFRGFFVRHPHVALIGFNGATAERLYQTLAQDSTGRSDIALVRLPSTSPAHAALRFEFKLQAWQAALDPTLHGQDSARPPATTAATSSRRSSSRVR
jgi:hypoxanthine-DNA glycosylase